MKTLHWVLSSILLIVSPLLSQENDHTSYKGVKTLTEHRYVLEENFGEIVERPYLKKVYNYDLEGNELKNREFLMTGTELGSLIYKKEYTLDPNRRVIEKREFTSPSHISSKTIYTRDSRGNPLTESNFDSDGKLRWKTISVFDENNNVTEKSDYDDDGSLKYKTKYQYNSDGFEIGYKEYRREGSVRSVVYKVDLNGNPTQINFLNPDGSILKKHHYTYDSNGNILEVLRYYPKDTPIDKTTFRYDKDNWRIELIKYNVIFEFGEIQEKPTRKYRYSYEHY